MQGIYHDPEYPDLVWMEFNGPTWNEFHTLFAELETFNATAEVGYFLAFYPTVDMPRGAPLNHIRQLISFLNHEPKVLGMVTVMPRHMIIAKTFADLVGRLFPASTPSSIVMSKEDVYEAYLKLAGKVRERE